MEATTTVRQLLKTKGADVWTIPPGSSVYDALAHMAEKNIGALVVTDGGRVVGILSERDYARKVILLGRASRDTTVAEVMTSQVISIRPEQTVQDCMIVMTERRIRHLPVIEADRLIGVVSIGDVVKAIISEQSFLIEQLQNYIQGAG